MYSWEKSLKEEKSRKCPKNPSFSSTLLDEIYRSIDGNDGKSQDWKLHKERSSAKQHSQQSNNTGGRAKSSRTVEDEEMASLRRACLIEKYMEKKVNEKISSRRKISTLPASELDNKLLLQDNDPLFFSSTSSSSDSSSGGLSSSDNEFFASTRSRKSCLASSRPKPVRTSVSPRLGQQKDEFFMLNDRRGQESDETEANLIKSKSRALKIYANLKKVKQPISPGGRLSSFLNSLFTSGNPKKTKNLCSNGGYEEANLERKSNSKSSTQASTCSSASSFSRSCLSKTSPKTRAKFNDGAKRTVTFYPVSVIVDEDCRPCGHKRIYDEDSDKFGRPPLSQNATELKLHKVEAIMALAEAGRSLDSIPKDLAAAIEAGRIPGSIVLRYFELEKSPVIRWLLNFGGFKERLLADDLFLTKVAIECGVGIFTKTAAEWEKRRENFTKELDFVCADVVMAIIADFMLVWLPAPTVSLRPPLAVTAGGLNKFFYGCPDNAFQVALSGTSYTLLQRIGAIGRNGAKLFAVGTSASLIGTGITNALMNLRKAVDKSFAGEGEDLPILSTSAAYGVYMAVSSNLRYQILAGVIEQRILEPLLHNHKLALSAICFAVRTGNTYLGSLMWVDYARWVGIQKSKE